MASYQNLELKEVVVEESQSPTSKEDLWRKLREAIKEKDEDSFHHHLSGLDELLQDDNKMKELLDGSLAYAAFIGFQPAVETLIQKGGDVNAMSAVLENHEYPDQYTPLHRVAHGRNVDTVRCFVNKGAYDHIEDDDSMTPLHSAAGIDHLDTVICLVDKETDTKIKDNGKTPIQLAVWKGHVDAVKYLVDKGADTNIKDRRGGTLLHTACKGDVEIVKYLLEKGADPTVKDNDGQTPLSWAIRSRHNDIAAFLLEHEKWKEMLMSSDRESATPMRGLIAFMPDVAERAFSRCVETNEGKDEVSNEEVHADSYKLRVTFNYEFLEDFQEEQSSVKQSSGEEGPTNIDASTKSWQPKKFTKHSHPLFLLKKHGCSHLMKHPLVISLLNCKWKKFGRYIFFGNFFIYLIFVTFLTAFGLVVYTPLDRPCTEVLNGSFNGTTPDDCEGLTTDQYRSIIVGATFTFATALLRLAIEVIQLYSHPLEYMQNWVNWLEIPMYLCSMTFTFVFATSCLCVYNWQWQIGVVTIFLSWIVLVSFLQKWPVTGIYVLMFINIIKSFLKIAFLALLLVTGFALAFYMLFFEPEEMRSAFSHPGRALVKVMTMTTGELDYDEIFNQHPGGKEIAFLPVSFLLWVIFLILIVVLFDNLLIGLAVGDVDSRLKTALENRIELQIDLVLTCEELLESQPIKKLFDTLHIHHWYAVQKSATLYPNAPETLLPKWCKGGKHDQDLVSPTESEKKSHVIRRRIAKRYAKWWVSDDYTSGVNICNKINPAQDPTAKQLQQQSDQLAKLQQLSEEQTQKLEEQTERLAAEVASLREALQKLLSKLDV